MMSRATIGEIKISGHSGSGWRCLSETRVMEPGLEELLIRLEADKPLTPPPLTVSWELPMLDMAIRWTPTAGFNRSIPPDWSAPSVSNLATSAPLMTFISFNGDNRLTVAVSEAIRTVLLSGGVSEETNRLRCKLELFSGPEAPLEAYEVTVRIDSRRIFYAEAIATATAWYASLDAYQPAPVPVAAYEPLYSTWYSYHQELFADELEKECELAKEYGLKGIIVDDGWQTDDNQRGYAFCGDWEISTRRFPDMRRHVEKIHRLGLKYLVWFSVPFVGDKSNAGKIFAGKFLYRRDNINTWVLDPRFPEVREYLIGIYENAVKAWDIDGLKLDFIDNFRIENKDPALNDNYSGRDIKSLPEAVDVLLTEAMRRLRQLKPDFLIEFRQSYIGPAIRKYGNMFRAADCPADAVANRVRTIDLRLTSGTTAVHSDMLEWHKDETAEVAALQLLNVLFSVPQISVKLANLPESHRQMLKSWLDFWRRHRNTLLHGKLRPYHPEMNYPLVSAEGAEETIIAVYHPEQIVKVSKGPGHVYHVVNATKNNELFLDLERVPARIEQYDVFWQKTILPGISTGLTKINVPCSGLLSLYF